MSRQVKADIVLLTITIIWGTSFTLMKNVLDYINPFTFLFLRFTTAAVVLSIIFYKKFKYINKKVLLHGSIVGIMLFGSLALQVSGLNFTTASNSAFLTGSSVIMVPLVASVFLKKKQGLSSIVGVILAFFGIFLISGGLNFSFNLGDLLTLLCAVCVTLQIIFIDKFMIKNDATLLGVLQVITCAVLYFCIWSILGFKPVILNRSVIITVLVTGVLGTAFAFAGQTIAQKYTSPTHTALIFTAEPVFGLLFAILIPNSQGITETITLTKAVGCILILGGMVVSEIKWKSCKADDHK